jgi:hypothetical protein
VDQTPKPTVTQTADPTVTIVEPPKVEEKKPEVKKPEEKKEPSLLNKKDDKAEGVPEKYTFTVPEGMEMSEEVQAKTGEVFKELGLTQAQADRLVAFHAEQTAAQAKAPYEAYLDMRKGWRDEVAADPEIGKQLPVVKQTIAKALDGLGQPELVKAFKESMDLTGAGDHPAFIKAFYYLAQKATEGKHVSGTGPTGPGTKAPGSAPRNAAQALYPNLPSANQS